MILSCQRLELRVGTVTECHPRTRFKTISHKLFFQVSAFFLAAYTLTSCSSGAEESWKVTQPEMAGLRSSILEQSRDFALQGGGLAVGIFAAIGLVRRFDEFESRARGTLERPEINRPYVDRLSRQRRHSRPPPYRLPPARP